MDGTLHNELEVQTSSQNFQRQVAIEGSEDGESWRTLQSNGVIFDLTVAERSFTTRETRVTYPDSTARFLRVRITDDGLEPLTIRGGVVLAEETPKDAYAEAARSLAETDEELRRRLGGASIASCRGAYLSRNRKGALRSLPHEPVIDFLLKLSGPGSCLRVALHHLLRALPSPLRSHSEREAGG